MKIRIVLLAIAAAAGVLLGTTHLGNNPLLPGAELGIAISITPAGDTIVVNHDSADMEAFVQLAIAPTGGDRFSAALDDGTVLGVTARLDRAGWFLRVHKAGGTSSSDKFIWPNGVPLRISRHASNPAAAMTVVDWQVFSKDNESDAAWKAGRRSTWRWISLLFLLLSAAGAVLTSIPESVEPAGKAHSARDSVAALIDEITGRDDQETKALRAYLRKRYIQSASLQESLDATGLSPAGARRIVIKARNILPARVLSLIGDLQRIYVELVKPEQPPEPAKHG